MSWDKIFLKNIFFIRLNQTLWQGLLRKYRKTAYSGVLGAKPLGEGVTEDREAGWRQGKAFPSFPLIFSTISS